MNRPVGEVEGVGPRPKPLRDSNLYYVIGSRLGRPTTIVFVIALRLRGYIREYLSKKRIGTASHWIPGLALRED